MKKIFTVPCLFFLLVFLTATPCNAEKDTLVLGIKTKIPALDITRSTTRQALIFSHNWTDTLVYRDPVERKIVPCLAESYRFIGTNAIEFKLRKGIKFHNGEPFNADTVKFSLDLLKDPESLTFRSLSDIKKAIVLDDYTVRIESSLLNLTALEIITNMLFMFPLKYYQEIGREKFAKHPIGTGPYRFVSWEKPNEIIFKANPDYFGKPKGKARIPYLKILIIPEEVVRIESLIKGQVDLLRSGSISPEQISFLEDSQDLKIRRSDILRNFFIIMDAFGRSGVAYFKDRRVRRAMNHAINKEAIISKVLKGYASINHSITTPHHFGHEPDVRIYPYNPTIAKKLLAEAGYPNGFSIDFYTYRDETVAEAISEYLRTVGIKTNIKWLGGKWDTLYKKLLAGELPLAYISWGSYSIFDARAIMNPFFMLDDQRCYGSTPQIDKMLKEADKPCSQEIRKALFSRAQKIIAEEAFCIPLWFGNSIAVMKKDLDFEPSYDEIDRYFTASWEE